jgi:hypothetical protein
VKTTKVATVENDIMRTCVRIDLKAIHEAGGALEEQTMDELIISFPSVEIDHSSIINAMLRMNMSTSDIDGVLENMHCDINQRMFKRYIK